MTTAVFALATMGAAPLRFESAEWLVGLAVVPVIAVLLVWSFRRRVRAAERFVARSADEPHPSAARAAVKIALAALGLSSLIVALARPQADPQAQTVSVRGRDILFIVDVSRSMLATDVAPNRLERTKLWIRDLTRTLSGDRVGLVAFAGVPVVKCPLTLDYGFFALTLDELSPASVPRGGTLIGDAIRKAIADVFEPGAGQYKDIILITDGEDQESFPVEAAKQAGELGVRLILIGTGNELEGSLVPAGSEGESKQPQAGQYVEFAGEAVRSRLDPSKLAEMAAAATAAGGTGVFLNVGTGTINLDTVYRDLVKSDETRESAAEMTMQYRELFPFALALALLCFAAEAVISERPRNRLPLPAAATRGGVALLCGTLALTVSSFDASAETAAPARAVGSGTTAVQSDAKPASPADLYNTGRELFASGDFAAAADHFRQADSGARDRELGIRSRFNLGQALLNKAVARDRTSTEGSGGAIADLDAAARAFRSVLALDPVDEGAARQFEIARALRAKFDQQRKQQEQQQQSEEQPDRNSGESQPNPDAAAEQESKNRKNAEQLRDLAQKQEDAAEKSEKAQTAASPEERAKAAGEAASEQKRVSEQTDEARNDASRKESGSTEETRRKLDAADEAQKKAESALARNDAKAAEENQRRAAELLREAAGLEERAADESKARSEQQAGKGESAEAKKAETRKYDETASQLLDRERQQREARQQILRALRGRPQPVERDW